MHFRSSLWISALVFMQLIFTSAGTYAQNQQDLLADEINIFQIMERTDLPLDEIEKLAEAYFKIHGTGKGSGYKQYQRWLYERQFHIDENGFFIRPEVESGIYNSFMHKQSNELRSIEPWDELGPSIWNGTSGWNPGIGRITSIAIHPSNESIIYVSSPGGGIWKSMNAGATWTPLTDQTNAPWMYIYHVRIDPSNQNTVYAAVMQGGVIKSTNAGNSWIATGGGPSNTRKVVVHPTNSNIVFATAANGVWRSTNAGTSWTQVHTGDAEDIEFKPNNPDIMYVSGNTNTIRRSTDNGISWTAIGAAGGITHSGRTLLGVTAANSNIVYAVQANVNLFGRMYKSTDAGLNYTTTVIGDPNNGTNYFGYLPDGTGTTGQAGYDMAICVNPVNADEVHIAGIICWKSNDGGFSFGAETEWNYPNGTGYNHADVHALEWINSTIYSGSDGGIYKSTNNGNDWNDISDGIGIRQIYRMSSAKSNSAVITIGSQDNGSSYRQSNGNWNDWLGGDGMDNMISPTNPNIAFGTSNGISETTHGQLYKTTDGGVTRMDFTEPSNGEWITPVAMHSTNHNEIYVGWTGLWKSTTGGDSWTNISVGAINQKLNCLAVAFDSDFIYASVGNKLYRTGNGGTTWDSTAMTQAVTSIYVSRYDPLKVWVTLNATANHVMASVNGGASFTSIASGLPALAARSVAVDEDDSNATYVGLNIGVYYRNDANPTWQSFGTGLPLVAVNEVEIHHTADKVRVATYGRGIWENDLELTQTEDCLGYAYVPNYLSHTVSVINLESNTVIATIPVGDNPYMVCHSSTGHEVYVNSATEDNVSVIETASQQVIATIALPANASPSGLGVTPDDAFLYISNGGIGTISVVNTSNHSIVHTIPIGGEPGAIQITPDGAKAYVTDESLDRISIINTSTYAIESTINMVNLAGDLKFTPDGTLAFVANSIATIYVISTASQTVIDSIQFPPGFYGTNIFVSPNGQKLFAGFGDDSPEGMGIIDIPSLSIETYATGFCCGVSGISTSEDGEFIYAANASYNKVSVINGSTYAGITSITVGTLPIAFGDFVIGCPGGGNTLCNSLVYDSGGPNADYNNDEDIIETLCPDDPADKIELTFQEFSLEPDFDFLKIFDGNTITDPPLHTGNGFTGSGNPGSFISTDPSGCLTLHFTSDFSVTDIGWEADVNCIPMNEDPNCEEYAYVPHSTQHRVSVVNLQTGAIIDSIPLEAFPSHGCHSMDGTKMYVSNNYLEEGGSVSVISTASHTIIDSIPLHDPYYTPSGMCMSPNDDRLYVSTSSIPPGNAKLYAINPGTNTVMDVLNIGGTITGLQVTPDGTKLFATNNRRDSVWVISTATNSVLNKIPMADWTYGIAIAPDGLKVFVSCHDESIQVINTATNSVIDAIPLSGRPAGLCFTPDGDKLYAALSFDDIVTVINPATHETDTSFVVSDSPRLINSSGNGTKMFVFNSNSDDIAVIATSNNAILTTFNSGGDGLISGDLVLSCNDTIANSDCGTVFSDSGGPSQNYMNDENIVTTLCPQANHQSIVVDFYEFSTEANYDALYIFDGNSINDSIIPSGNPATNSGFPPNGFYGTSLPGSFQSSHETGCLTFQFLSDNSVTRPGWNATVECVVRPINDLCENAIPVNCSDIIFGTNVNATFDTDLLCNTSPGVHGVWYKFIGTGDEITLTTCHPSTNFDTQIHVYTGSCTDFECLAGNDDDFLCSESSLYSTVVFQSVPGEEYFISVSGFLESFGDFALEVNCDMLPSDENCLHFDGVNDNVYGPSSTALELVDGTIELWIKPEMKSTSQTFVCYRNNAGSATRYLFNFLGNLSGLGFWNGTAYATFSYTFSANQWYHLAFVDDGDNTKIYINGAYAGAFNLEFSAAAGSGLHLVLGYDLPLSEYFKGSIDELRIWNIPLSENTISDNRFCGLSGTEECLVAYYRFNQGTAGGNNAGINILFDESANSLDCTLNNFALAGSTSNWLQSTQGVTGTCSPVSCNTDIIAIHIEQPCLEAGADTLFYYPTWTESLGLSGEMSNGSITLDPSLADWSSSSPGVVSVTDGFIEAISPGIATVFAEIANVPSTSVIVKVIAPSLAPVINTLPAALMTPHNECAVRDMPVFIIRYLPTSDGVNLDVGHAPDYFSLGEITLEEMEETLEQYDYRIKFALEEGTRFRDYGEEDVPSYLGYRVVGMITVYEPTPRGDVFTYDINGLPVFFIDYFSMFERFNLDSIVDILGAKEIWLWQYGSDSGYPSYDPEINLPCNFRHAWESNMASPVTGDVSNSNQDTTDLPVFDQTYILYGQNIRRSQAEAIHNHGHQLERMFPHINYLQDGNTELFWHQFVGQNPQGEFITGRCGWTHMPPNTTTHYDYQNPTLVLSDIKQWTPAGGSQSLVNVNTWGDLSYEWPGASTFSQRIESQWYIFWMQSIPGNGNTIPYGPDYLTNWWSIIADWDQAITDGYTLYSPVPAPLEYSTVVTTLLNAGYGSLRSTIACAPSGSTVTFSPFITSDTITILTPIPINKNITVTGASNPGLLIDASSSTYAFDVQSNGVASFLSLQIKCGLNAQQSGLRNYGITELHDMIFTTNLNTPIISNHNTLRVYGLTSLLK